MNDLQNDGLKEAQKPAPGRKARRKSAAWKSGLMLAGLGAVVLGGGYLAGVNAPAVAQAASQASAQSAAASANSQSQAVAPGEERESEEAPIIGFDDQGNPVILNDDGSLQFGSNAIESQVPAQQFGRRGRQFGGASQQAPSFSGPTTRSRGS